MRANRRRAAVTFLALGLASAVLLVGCSSRQAAGNRTAPPSPTAHNSPSPTSSAAKPLFDPAQADALAHAAIPQASELPGSGWSVESVDQFDDSNSLQGIPQCSAFDKQITSNPANRAGRAEAQFQRQPANPNALEIPGILDVEVEIYHSAQDTDAPWTIVQRLIDSPEFGDCIQAMGKSELSNAPQGMTFTFSQATAVTKPPHTGAAFGIQASISYLGFTFQDVVNVYVWPYGNAMITATVGGPPSVLTPGYVDSLLLAVDTKVRAAAKQ